MKRRYHRIFVFVPLGILICLSFINCGKKSTKEKSAHCSILPQGWLDFGPVETCCGTAHRSFEVANSGGGILTGSVTIGPDCDNFRIVSGDSSYSLGAGEAKMFTVEFRPQSVGENLCEIETGNVLCPDVSCRGEGVSPP